MAGLLPAAAAAGDIPGVLRVAAPGDYAPYAQAFAGEAPRGADVELVQEVALILGMGIEWVATSWPTLQADALAGRFDLAVGGVSITAARQAAFPFTRALLRDYKTPVVRCGEETRYDTLAELDQPTVRVVVNPGGTNERFARSHFANAGLRVHTDNHTVFNEIAAGRADVMVTDAVEARLQQRLLPGLCAVDGTADWEPADKAFWVTGAEQMRVSVDAALKQSLAREPYAQRIARWTDSPWPAGGDSTALHLMRLADERLAVVVDVARWKWNRAAAIEDLQREGVLIGRLRAQAAQRGLSADAVEQFFRAQIDAAKLLQADLFAGWSSAGAGSFSRVADLDGVLRPRIDAINERMLEALARWDGQRLPRARSSAFTIGSLSPAAVEQALEPLLTQGELGSQAGGP